MLYLNVLLSIDKHSTLNDRQFGGCLIKILRYIMLLFQFNYLQTILHIIMSKMALILLTLPIY